MIANGERYLVNGKVSKVLCVEFENMIALLECVKTGKLFCERIENILGDI